MVNKSVFDGGLLDLILHRILAALIILITLAIATPWTICMLQKWETEHTVINGHRLSFYGTGVQLIGNWIKWLLLTIITLGIYGFWVEIKMKQWIVLHTH